MPEMSNKKGIPTTVIYVILKVITSQSAFRCFVLFVLVTETPGIASNRSALTLSRQHTAVQKLKLNAIENESEILSVTDISALDVNEGN